MLNIDNQLHIISQQAVIDEKKITQENIQELQEFFDSNYSTISQRSKELIKQIQNYSSFSVEKFLQVYSLNSTEGVAVMCLAESLLRIPDTKIAFELAHDKLHGKKWLQFISFANNILVNFSTIGLAGSAKFVDLSNLNSHFGKLVTRFGRKTFIDILKLAMKILSREFILGNNIDEGIKRAAKNKEFNYSYDLLGESARNHDQAEAYYLAYLQAVEKIGAQVDENADFYHKPNLSVKLSALHPRVELIKKDELFDQLYTKLKILLTSAEKYNFSISFDAEEAFRLDIYLELISKLLHDKDLANYDGIGLVIQAYQKRAKSIIQYIIEQAKATNRKIPIRLVKGAYWDTEIKHAHELGLTDFPVFTRKEFTDLNYLHCAKLMLDGNKYLYSQFATHNAFTIAAIEQYAALKNITNKQYELQKLYGMGDALHSNLVADKNIRIYAPVGNFEDLLAYLMRRLLENGANTSFVNLVNDSNCNIDQLVFNPINKCNNLLEKELTIMKPEQIYNDRKNSTGFELGIEADLEKLKTNIDKFKDKQYQACSIVNGSELIDKKHASEITKPAKNSEIIGYLSKATSNDMQDALNIAKANFDEWANTPAEKRAHILEKIAEIYETNQYELLSILIREGGKTIDDAIAELREAIDFCRYYATQMRKHAEEIILPGPTGERNSLSLHPKGIFVCISPWNFPLAIFTGQIVAGLVTGNMVIAKPAEQTSIIANFAVKLMLQAGIPKSALHLLIAGGSQISKYVLSDAAVSGVAFTGSTETARVINRNLAERDAPIAVFIAETGGQNAMIVDSSSLLEQVTDDVINSAFKSAGQRCSALRVLYIQEEIFEPLIDMLKGAVDTLNIGNPSDFSVDIGPVIDSKSKKQLAAHIEEMRNSNFEILKQHYFNDEQNQHLLANGTYICPTIIKVNSINDIKQENFGPILHVISYKSNKINKVIDEINNYGYGLTFGIHSRIENKIEEITAQMKVGNMYVNRGMTGAVVGTQPFGGENNSGTGFKAGGPHYLLKFMNERTKTVNLTAIGGNIELLTQNDK